MLVTGFGPFLDVVDNPSARLAEALSGVTRPAWRATGLELPTSFARAPRLVAERLATERFDFLLALGVGRSGLRLEARAAAVVESESLDVDGEAWAGRVLGDGDRESALPLARWASLLSRDAMAVEVSRDCGGYVCNAMNYFALAESGLPALFVHVPRELAVDPRRFGEAVTCLSALLDLVVADLPVDAGEVAAYGPAP